MFFDFGAFNDPFGAFFDQPNFYNNDSSDSNLLYEILGVNPNASTQQITKAFRKLCKIHHPDKGGDVELFKQISRAYEVLSNPETRELYDRFGENGLEMGASDNFYDMDDQIQNFFHPNQRSHRSHSRKGKDVTSILKVTMNDIFLGCVKALNITRNVVCPSCKGSGFRKGNSQTQICNACEGEGNQYVLAQVGFGISQVRVTCENCNGRGKVLVQAPCKNCNGQRTVKEKKQLRVVIDKGTPDGHCISFNGEADRLPNLEPGNIIVKIQIQPHPQFELNGHHLFLHQKVDLISALTGYSFEFTHLDGRKIRASLLPGQIITPDSCLCIYDQGMPFFHSFGNGNIFVIVDIVYPECSLLTDDIVTKLKKVFSYPNTNTFPIDDEDEEVFLTSDCPYIEQKEDYNNIYDEDTDYHTHDQYYEGPPQQCYAQLSITIK